MSRRWLNLIIVILMIAALPGCMASAQTVNLYAEEEQRQFDAQTASAETTEQDIVEITPAPTRQVTPFIPTASPSPSPSASPEPEATFSPTPIPIQTPAYSVEKTDDKKAYLNAGCANLRKGPGTDYDIICEMKANTRLTVTGTCGEWLRVEAREDTGFVLAEFVEYGSPPTAKPAVTASPTKKPSSTASASPQPTVTQTAQPTDTPSGSDNESPISDANGFTAEEMYLIAQVVYEEEKETSLEGQAAVANVIYNRIVSSRFPNTVEGVIFQKNQFTVANDEDALRTVKPGSTSIAAVKQIFADGDTFLPMDVMYFRTASKGTFWSSSYKYYATYGNNCFFIYIG